MRLESEWGLGMRLEVDWGLGMRLEVDWDLGTRLEVEWGLDTRLEVEWGLGTRLEVDWGLGTRLEVEWGLGTRLEVEWVLWQVFWYTGNHRRLRCFMLQISTCVAQMKPRKWYTEITSTSCVPGNCNLWTLYLFKFTDRACPKPWMS